MATLALAGVGAAIGGMWGYASIGWAVGSALGSYFFAPDGPDIEGPRLSDLSIQSSAYGASKLRTWGAMRQAGNVIWSTKIKETEHKEDVGGKGGGGGGTQTTYTYSITMAVAFGEGPIAGIRRIWANGTLIFDNSDKASGGNLLDRLSLGDSKDTWFKDRQNEITLYTGSETQDPDPTIEAIDGAGNAPAYRGTPYIVFDNLELADFGNRPPNIEAEIVDYGSNGGQYEAVAGFLKTDGAAIIEDDYAGVSYPYGSVEKSFTDYLGRAWILIGWEKATPAFSEGRLAIPEYQANSQFSHAILKMTPVSEQVISGDFRLGITHNGRGDHIFSSSELSYLVSCLSSTYDGYGEWALTRKLESLGFTIWGQDGERSVSVTIPDLTTTGDYSVTVERRSGILSLDVYVNDVLVGTGTQTGSADNTPLTAEVAIAVGGRADGAYLPNDYATGTYHDFYFISGGGVSLAPVPISTIISDLCDSAGLSSADYDASQLTDTVHGYSRTRPMTVRRAIEPLQQAFWFDAIESDWQLQFIPRGGVSVATIGEEELSAHMAGDSPPPALETVRQQEVELPRAIRVKYRDAAADYRENVQTDSRIITDSDHVRDLELPIAMTNDRGARAAQVLMGDAWTGRNTQQFKLPPRYAYLDPADVIALVVGGATHSVRIQRMADSGPIAVEAVANDAANYTTAAIGFDSPAAPQTRSPAGPTRLWLLDIPILRDADDDAGYYIGANGYLDGWRGAVAYQSTDGGETYAQLIALFTGPITGTAADALADGPIGIIDEGGSVAVRISKGSLSSITDTLLLDGESNAAAIGADGRWELIQFRDATLNADGTYTLSHLVRGRRGTEWATDTHQAGDTFVLLSSSSLRRVVPNESAIGISRLYKGVSLGKTLTGAEAISFSNDAVGLMPYAPAHLSATDNGNGTFDVTWIRRTRVSGEWRDLVGAPLGEGSESYRVKVFRAGVEISSADVSSASATVTAVAGDTIKVAQISATVGAGYYAEVPL